MTAPERLPEHIRDEASPRVLAYIETLEEEIDRLHVVTGELAAHARSRTNALGNMRRKKERWRRRAEALMSEDR